LSESELIGLMEKNGIGTDASMASHINNIVEREYVKIVGARKLAPTELGLSLIHGYNDIDKDLSSPELRSNIEKSVDLIAKVFLN
jgi:DNA topoisomerase-3